MQYFSVVGVLKDGGLHVSSLPLCIVILLLPLDLAACTKLALHNWLALISYETKLTDGAGPHAVHDPDYRASLNDFNTFIEGVTQKLIEIDDTIPELPIKDIVRRSLLGSLVLQKFSRGAREGGTTIVLMSFTSGLPNLPRYSLLSRPHAIQGKRAGRLDPLAVCH